ncbi:uncharacterized protein TNCV_1638401 [Trichonephila clavipes]|nr:uncharacterized protein TNCV_1638401 [Trichonephila clavipes]
MCLIRRVGLRALIGSYTANPSCLGGYTNMFERDNVGTLSESSEFLHLAHSLKSATSSSGKVLLSSGKCFTFVGFNERRSHRQSQTLHFCPNGLLTNVIVKRALAAVQCVFINDHHAQSMPTQSGVNIEVISSSICLLSTAPAADVLPPSLIRSVSFIFLRS